MQKHTNLESLMSLGFESKSSNISTTFYRRSLASICTVFCHPCACVTCSDVNVCFMGVIEGHWNSF